jgi:tetratricopeptide (TPR) repeat protein
MTNFQDVSEAIPAKHILFVTDACYSGVALTRGAPPSGRGYLEEVTRRSVRQMLTAGGADEEVADNGPNGHSVFTWTLLQGLEGRADLSGDGYVTASELAAYVTPAVSSLSRQTPVFGNLAGSEGGDFVFELKHDAEYLSQESAQLEDEGIRLNAELDRIRAQLAEKRARNEQLRKEVEAARSQLAGGPPAADAAPVPASGRIDRGTGLFREKRYREALAEFEEAARLDPKSALAANNVGFTHYRLGDMEKAVAWFEKTLALDPNRAIAHANLGDALLALGRRPDARREYEAFLRLQPTARYADEVRRRLAGLE